MVQYARNRYTHPKLRFEEFDLSKDIRDTSEIWAQGFDKIFSFYCLHWIPDQRYDLLVDTSGAWNWPLTSV
jgi:hypothetical protein